MVNRIQEILKRYNLSSAKFADQLEVPRSTISHILSERNKPSLEFIQKVIDNYPDININWLLKGEGHIFGKEKDLFSEIEHEPTLSKTQHVVNAGLKEKFTAESEISRPAEQLTEEDLNLNEEKSFEKEVNKQHNQPVKAENKAFRNEKKIVRIITFYADNTFEEYFPSPGS